MSDNNEFVIDESKIIYNGPMKLAIVPGSFKPPHKGHWEMVMAYINQHNVDKVIILISNISRKANSLRPLTNTNLKHFDKIEQFARDNGILNDKILEIFNLIKKERENITLNFEKLSGENGYLDRLTKESDTINTIDSNFITDFKEKIDNYKKFLEQTIFKSIRKAGTFEITPEISKQIFEIFAKAYGVENKVDIIIPDSPSPISAAYGFFNYNCKNCEVILGTSKKGGDDTRWDENTIKENLKNKTNIVYPLPVDVKTMLSATDLRNNIDNLNKDYFPEKISDDDFEKIKELLKNSENKITSQSISYRKNKFNLLYQSILKSLKKCIF